VAPVTAQLRETLRGAANPGGGWPYYAGKRSRIEPTCWALLALAGIADDASEWLRFAGSHMEWLARTQRADGLLVDATDAPANFTSNGLAVCVLAHLGPAGPSVARLVDALIAAKGISVNEPDPRQDNTLQGWPWLPDTFSWLEPTAWCLLALKKTGRQSRGATARIEEGNRLIVNRVCESGGWNYGNASVVGQDLRPYVPTTAIALLALQDQPHVPAVERSVAWLRGARVKEPSASALALACIALRAHDLPVEDVEARLAADVDRAERVGNLQALAMMLCALSASAHAVKSLRLEA
jgi:hypothetical protein